MCQHVRVFVCVILPHYLFKGIVEMQCVHWKQCYI